jgi:type VI secretion system protein ImpH
MATQRRRTLPPLEETLFQEPYRFDFFQAVRLLERLAPDRKAVGNEGPPSAEAVRFRAETGLTFPASEVPSIAPPTDSQASPQLTVAFMGLTGPLGVLPYCYSELIVERLQDRTGGRKNGDRTLLDFLDLFNHRLISLFYRAWEKHRPALAFERGETDRAAGSLFSLIGLGIEPLRDRQDFPDAALLFYAGAFAQRHRPPVMLERILGEYFRLPVEVHPFQGRWLRLDDEDRSTLGASGRHNGLGKALVMGGKVWDEQSKFRLRIGPLTFDQFQRLGPEGQDLQALTQMVRLYVDGEFDFDVQLVLKAEEVPKSQLTKTPNQAARLGRTAWLKTRPMPKDADDAVFPSSC